MATLITGQLDGWASNSKQTLPGVKKMVYWHHATVFMFYKGLVRTTGQVTTAFSEGEAEVDDHTDN